MESVNISNITSLQDHWNIPLEIRIRRIIIGSIIVITGFISNLLALYGTVRLNKRWTPERCLMVNFCVCHLAYCLTSGDQMVRYATKPYFGYVNCQIRALMVYVSFGCTVFSMILITFHRYFRVVFLTYPNLGFSTVKKTLVGIGVSWAFNFAVLLLPLTKLWGGLGLEPTNQICRILTAKSKFFDTFLVMTYTIVPIILQAVCYLHICIKVRRQNRVVAPDNKPTVFTINSASQGAGTSLTMTPPGSSGVTNDNPTGTHNLRLPGVQANGAAVSQPAANDAQNPVAADNNTAAPTSNAATTKGPKNRRGAQLHAVTTAAERRRKREIRLALLAFGFVMTYVLCFVPYSVTNALNMLYHPVHEFTLSLVWAFVAINPMMYILGEERVRQVLKRRLMCRCK